MKFLLLLVVLIGLFPVVVAQPDAGNYGTYLSRDNAGNFTGFVVLPTDQLEGFCFVVTYNTYDQEGNILYSEVGYGKCQTENGRFPVNYESDQTNMWLEFGKNETGKSILTIITNGKPNRIYYLTAKPFSDKPVVEKNDLRVYRRDDNSTITIWSDNGVSMFKAEQSPAANCAVHCVDGMLDMDSAPDTWLFKLNGCKAFQLTITGNVLTVTEKLCKGLERESCSLFTGEYTLEP